ncbi:phosphoglycolate phosphatase [Larsenimonas salina]|uniref:phosphoglycolate phosphatase n=1 Tax=Larsenimonas salina TaxID=1295565 RepID=UPI0020742377|nr:phosphoglycolate phosphatase [Larsenimonas salina]MCM5703049.1 phosphoglycolate phosphatase [Larsenimonas salina]
MHHLLDSIDLILFDLDGTLVDSAPDLGGALAEAMSERGYPAPRLEAVRDWVGNGSYVLVERALNAARDQGLISPFNEATVDSIHQRFLHHYGQRLCRNTDVYPGVRESLAAFKQSGRRLAVVTNKPALFITPILEGLQLGGLFDLLVGGDTLAVKKPDPGPLEHAMAAFSVPAERTLMVGDSINDIRAAQAAGCQSVALTYGYNHGQPIDEAGATLVIESLAQLV